MVVNRKNIVVLVISAMILLMVLFHVPLLSDAWMAPSPPILMRHRRNSISSHHRHCKPRLYGIASLLSCSKIDSSTALRASTATTTPIMVEESHSSNGDSTMTVEQNPMEPRLRGLYTPPPTRVADNSTEDGWITEVTNGTMSTGPDGSPHILYYEVHRRSYRNMSSSTTSSSTTATTPTATEKKQGLTALFLHGGPGASCNTNHVRFFNPQYYETVVLLDQRGCGRSVPLGEVSYNTLELLVEDIEQLRHVIFSSSSSNNDEHESTTSSSTTRPWDTILGGSWGCTLALAYAHTYPTNVRSMVLRGVCMFRTKEIDWLFGDPPPPLYNGDINNNKNNNNGMRSTTANLRLLLEGDSERGKRRDTSSIPTATTNKNNVITTGTTTTTTTTVTTAAEIFPTGWDEFRKGSVTRPKSPFSKQRTSAQPTTIPPRQDTLYKYYNLILGSTDPMVRNDAVKSWLRWEMGIYSSGFCNVRGPTTTTTSSSRVAHQDEEKVKKNFDNNNNYTVLVYYPSTSSWSYEDTRVWTNDSFVSIGSYNNNEMREQPDEMANSLRRFSTSSSSTVSSTTSSLGLTSLHDDGILRPLPFDSMDATSSPSGRNNSTTPTPTTYIPAQSMLTVFYSANDDYCIGRYKSFLSMERQQPHQLSNYITANKSSRKSSWFSSALPPEMPVLTTLSNNTQFSSNPVSSSTKSSTMTTSSFPLPPTIAIQGGNDAICPPDTALDLHEVWKEMELRIVLQSGHSMYDPLIAGEIVKALDRFGYYLIDT